MQTMRAQFEANTKKNTNFDQVSKKLETQR